MTPAELKLRRARSRMMDQWAAYGALSTRLKLVEDASVDFLRTDGSVIRYNPATIDELPELQIIAGVAHEVSHCALLHPWRIGSRDPKLYNIAADHTVNLQLLADHVGELWQGALADPRFAGMSAEQVYAILEAEERQQQGAPQPQPQPGQQPGQGGASGQGPGQPDFDPAPPDDGGQDSQDGPQQGQQPAPGQAPRMTAADWQAAAEQAAAVGRKAGTMAGELARAMKAAYASRTDWRTATRRWLENMQPSDYSWARADRRYLALGYMVPGIVRENMPALGIAVDTSGSISQAMLDLFAVELTAILHELRPERLIVVYADTRVQAVEEFTPDDPRVELHAHGGGGTDFQPAIDYFAGEDIAGLIYLTDLIGPVAREPMGFDVLWGVDERHADQIPPFGSSIVISPYS